MNAGKFDMCSGCQQVNGEVKKDKYGMIKMTEWWNAKMKERRT